MKMESGERLANYRLSYQHNYEGRGLVETFWNLMWHDSVPLPAGPDTLISF